MSIKLEPLDLLKDIMKRDVSFLNTIIDYEKTLIAYCLSLEDLMFVINQFNSKNKDDEPNS